MKRGLFMFWFMFVYMVCQAQIFKQISTNDGLSHRHVYSIIQDDKGYMWFLTHDGVDRFNGSEYKHYPLLQQNHKLNTSVNLKELFYTDDKILWQMGANGQVFRYNEASDQFDIIYSYPTEPNQTTMLDFGYIDNSQHIWMGNKGNIQIYNYQKRKAISITQHPLYASSSVTEMGNSRYAIGTYQGIYLAEIRNDSLVLDTKNDNKLLSKLPVHIDYLYYHKESDQLIIATLKDGLYAYNLTTKQLSSPLKIRGTSVNQIVTYDNDEVLIATSGAGVYKLNVTTNKLTPFIIADYSTYDGMSGNNIKDIYIDKERQIWLATYPTGITVCQENQTNFTWFKHILKDHQSLVHDEVNYVTEDSDGDLWFATTNGISLLRRKSNKWQAYLSTYNGDSIISNHMFVSLSEVRPGILWAGGYNSGIYEINKRTGQVKLVTENNALIDDQQPERNVKAILTTSDQNIWVGGQYNLRQVDYKTKNIRFFSELSSVTALEEKDESNLWVGTARGLYILDKKTGKSRKVVLPNQISFINSLSQSSNGNLYIGTNEGLIIFITKDGTFKHFHKNNSRLISNDIRTIIAGRDNQYVYFAYEKALGRLQTDDHYIRNWTKDQGLPISSFAQNSGEQLENGDFIFGSADGAILFSKGYLIPEDYRSTLVFEDLEINQNKISPSGYNNILTTSLDNTKELVLKYNENNLSLKVASINFRYPSNISYTWVMEGLYDRWSYPSTDTKMSFNNLSPGKYVFKIKAISNEDNIAIQERQLSIVIKPPFWWNLYSKIVYLIIIIIIIIFVVRYFTIRFKKQIENDTKQLYYNAAHDVKVPLQLIKESLQQINDDEKHLSKGGLENIRVILRNINDILTKNDSVINYERMEQSKERLFLSEHHLSKFIGRIVDESQTYAEFRNTKLVLTDNLDAKDNKSLFDKEKVNTILLTLINEIIKRATDGKPINIVLSNNLTQWLFLITYEGDSITIDEIKHNNQGETNNSSDVENNSHNLGLSLVSKLVQIHKGEIQILNNERTNISKVSVVFPIFGNSADLSINDNAIHPLSKERHFAIEHITANNKTQPIVLIAEDNLELIQELTDNLKDQYQVEIANNGKKAIELAIQLRPDIILSKMHLGDMKGSALAFAIKSNLETSHIPFMVMTDKNDEKHIIKGLENGPDDFILKPFNYRILKASMQNLLESKAILKDRYASLELQESLDCQYCSTNLDWKFIATVKSEVENHMAEPDFNIDKLCSILNMSRTSFYNKLKDLTNQSPSDFIKIIKLKHAAQQLTTGEYTIVEIAEQTGFNDAKYFREVFKKHFDMTPSKYAKENKL